MNRTLFVGCLLSLFAVSFVIGCGGADAPAPDADQAAAPAPTETPAAGEDPAPATDATPAAAAGGPLNVDEAGRALRGFDAVAYHADGQAVAGLAEHAVDWQGATWLFATAENRERFAAEPERFAPQNGGYCTFGVVLGKKLDVDPERFLVQDDDLYLFLNAEVQEKFNADLEGNLTLVISNWPTIADQHPDELDKASS
ncbi:MAG: YHS domain-containing (seleno)protein [Acidobacteriota bacterium]